MEDNWGRDNVACMISDCGFGVTLGRGLLGSSLVLYIMNHVMDFWRRGLCRGIVGFAK